MRQMGGTHAEDGGTHAPDGWGRVLKKKMAGLKYAFAH